LRPPARDNAGLGELVEPCLDRASRHAQLPARLEHPDARVGVEQGEQSAVEIVHRVSSAGHIDQEFVVLLHTLSLEGRVCRMTTTHETPSTGGALTAEELKADLTLDQLKQLVGLVEYDATQDPFPVTAQDYVGFVVGNATQTAQFYQL